MFDTSIALKIAMLNTIEIDREASQKEQSSYSIVENLIEAKLGEESRKELPTNGVKSFNNIHF